MRIIASIPALFVALILAGCSTAQPEPAPAPPPLQTAKPTPPAPPPAPKPDGDWTEWPIAQGMWVYRNDARGSLALFGEADETATFLIRCDAGEKRLYLSRAGSVASGAAMVLRASSGKQSFPARSSGGSPPYAAISLAPDEYMMDRIAYSRGRFAVEVTGLPAIAIPVQPEFARVVEDCRG